MAKLTFQLSPPHGSTTLELDFVKELIDAKRPDLAAYLRAQGCADYPVDYALAIYLYTLEEPPIYEMLNQPMRSPTRAEGPNGMSMTLRGSLPMIKYLDTALEEAPAKFEFSGRCQRGVKYVYPSPGSSGCLSWSVRMVCKDPPAANSRTSASPLLGMSNTPYSSMRWL